MASSFSKELGLFRAFTVWPGIDTEPKTDPFNEQSPERTSRRLYNLRNI